MNGSEIRLLAERASVLEDRTPDRLLEIQERVASARGRRRMVVVVAVAAVTVIVLAISVALVTVGPVDRSPDPAPTPSPEADADASRPAEGTCWAVPPEEVSDFRKDASPQVPCGQDHTTETVVVLNLPSPTAEDAEQAAGAMCWDYVRAYLGVDGDSWVPWGWVAFLPSQEQIDDGASWVRCDAAFPASTEWTSGVRATSVSAAGIADSPTVDFWACVDEPFVIGEDQPLVRCDRPHRYEETGRLAGTFGQQDYPTKQQRLQFEAACEEGIPPWLADLQVDAAWLPRAYFTPGLNVDAICYVSDPDGGLLPGVRPGQLEGSTP